MPRKTKIFNGYSFSLEKRHQTFFARCLAEFKSYDETIRLFLVEFAEEVHKKLAKDAFGELQYPDKVRHWLYKRADYYWNHPDAHEWQALARKLRKKWLDGIGDVMLAHKRARLDELQKEYFKLPDKYVDKVLKSETEGEIIVHKFNSGGKVQILDQIRKEVEGTRLNLSGSLNIEVNFDELTDEQLERIAEGADVQEVLDGESSI